MSLICQSFALQRQAEEQRLPAGQRASVMKATASSTSPSKCAGLPYLLAHPPRAALPKPAHQPRAALALLCARLAGLSEQSTGACIPAGHQLLAPHAAAARRPAARGLAGAEQPDALRSEAKGEGGRQRTLEG